MCQAGVELDLLQVLKAVLRYFRLQPGVNRGEMLRAFVQIYSGYYVEETVLDIIEKVIRRHSIAGRVLSNGPGGRMNAHYMQEVLRKVTNPDITGNKAMDQLVRVMLIEGYTNIMRNDANQIFQRHISPSKKLCMAMKQL